MSAHRDFRAAPDLWRVGAFFGFQFPRRRRISRSRLNRSVMSRAQAIAPMTAPLARPRSSRSPQSFAARGAVRAASRSPIV